MAGTGSLGQQRFVAIGEWKGACIAREAKAMVPSACVRLGGSSHGPLYSERIPKRAVRSHDPFQVVKNGWLIRRLSPDSNPIEIFTWPKERDEALLLGSMGRELANAHVGSSVSRILISTSLSDAGRGWRQKRWRGPWSATGGSTARNEKTLDVQKIASDMKQVILAR